MVSIFMVGYSVFHPRPQWAQKLPLLDFTRESFETDDLNKSLTLWPECTDQQVFSAIACFILKPFFSHHCSQRNPKCLFLDSIRSGFSTCWTKTNVQHCENNPDISKYFHTSLFLASFKLDSVLHHSIQMAPKCPILDFQKYRVSNLLNQN